MYVLWENNLLNLLFIIKILYFSLDPHTFVSNGNVWLGKFLLELSILLNSLKFNGLSMF